MKLILQLVSYALIFTIGALLIIRWAKVRPATPIKQQYGKSTRPLLKFEVGVPCGERYVVLAENGEGAIVLARAIHTERKTTPTAHINCFERSSEKDNDPITIMQIPYKT